MEEHPDKDVPVTEYVVVEVGDTLIVVPDNPPGNQE